jgi:hypothetical protein
VVEERLQCHPSAKRCCQLISSMPTHCPLPCSVCVLRARVLPHMSAAMLLLEGRGSMFFMYLTVKEPVLACDHRVICAKACVTWLLWIKQK